MFDLEYSIAQWRKQMLADGVKTQPLEELENHLREDFERRVKLGMPQPDALKIAIAHIGTGAAIKSEYKKAGDPMMLRLVKLTGIACIVTAGFFLSVILSEHLFDRETGFVPKLSGVAAIATIFLSWGYGHKILPAIRHQWIRAAIGGAECIVAVLGIQYLAIFVVPDSLARAAGTEQLHSWFLAFFLWAWSLFAILGGLIYGLEKAADKHKVQYV